MKKEKLGKTNKQNKEKKASKKRKGRVFIFKRLNRVLTRTKKYSKKLRRRHFVTFEQEARVYGSVILEEYYAICIGMHDAFECLWEFLAKLGRDFVDIVLAMVWLLKKLFYLLKIIFEFIGDRFWDLMFYLERKKTKLFLMFSTLVSVFALVLILLSSMTAYKYSYYGKTLGIAKSKEEVYRIIELLGDKISDVKEAKINIDVTRDISFEKVYGFNLDVDTTDEMINTLTYMKDFQATGYAINIEGENVVIMQSEDAAKNLLNSYKNNFAGIKDGVEYSVNNFKENVSIVEVKVLLGDLWNEELALNYLLTGKLEGSEEEGSGPMLTLYSVETATYEEPIDYGKEYIDNSGLYTDETQLISDGIKGTNLVVATIERINGEEISREILSTTVITNPINAVYYQGTKPIPASKGKGYFIFPLGTNTYYVLTSIFGGYRPYFSGESTYHTGIDLACAEGSYVYAADGGTVIYAGYGSGLGNCVFIDHGGLLRTIYGHLSEVWVKVGDNISQGTIIGLSGSTGVSTGPHLHFEVRYKDVRVDPLNYIKLR